MYSFHLTMICVRSMITETNTSFSDYIDYWFDNYVMVNCKYNTQEYYRRTIDRHIKPLLGMHKLKAITPNLPQEFLNKKALSGLSKSSISNFYGILSKTLRMAVHPYKYINSSPIVYVEMTKFDDSIDDKLKIITTYDYYRILLRFPKSSHFHVPLKIGYYTGMRVGEVFALT